MQLQVTLPALLSKPDYMCGISCFMIPVCMYVHVCAKVKKRVLTEEKEENPHLIYLFKLFSDISALLCHRLCRTGRGLINYSSLMS